MKRSQFMIGCLFFGVLFLILFALEKMFDSSIKKSSYVHFSKVNMIAGKHTDAEIAIFGSSVGEGGIVPRVIDSITKRSAYNYSIAGTRFIQYNGLVKEFNANSKDCRLVVFVETSFSLENINRLTEVNCYVAHTAVDNIYNSLHDVQPLLAWKLRYIPFYEFVVMNHNYYKAAEDGVKRWLKGMDNAGDSLKGYTPMYKEWPTSLDDVNRKLKPINIVIHRSVVEAYEQTIHELLAKGRKLLIIIPPIQSGAARVMPGIDTLRRALSSFVREGVYFRDYSSSGMSANKKYFYNYTHLNNEGAEIFSKQLGMDIKNILEGKGQ